MNDELRPKFLRDIIGLDNLKSCLSIAINAAKKEKRAVENIFLEGSAGHGKTTVAMAIGNELQSKTTIVNCANLKDVKALYKILLSANDGDIVFYDEVHVLDKRLQEILYHAVEDNLLVIPLDNEIQKINLHKFTSIAATTDSGRVTKSLRDRFAFQFVLGDYTVDDMRKLCTQNDRRLQLKLDTQIVDYIAKISKNTPRILNSRLKWIRDYKLSKNISRLSLNDVKSAFLLYGLDENGFSDEENRYIDIVKQQGPIGIQNISDILGLGRGYVEQHIEKPLLKEGIIHKTPSGRVHRDSENDAKSDLAKLLKALS